jgi:catechol 2,3-dioxygenase-like lactoylglutathione lyase family enzyme
MLDHIGFDVSDFARARAFYDKALAPLGITALMEVTREQSQGEWEGCGMGEDGKPFFWIGTPRNGQGLNRPVHVAFVAQSRAQVDAFYEAAIAAGGVDNGRPGLRPHYHANYYGAFVRDPDGHNIEAVCHKPA